MKLCVCNSFPPAVPLKQFQGLTDKGPFSSFLCLSPHGDWLCDVLGFVPVSSVSSSSTFQIFRDASHFWWLFPLSVCLLSHSLDSVMSRTVHHQGSSKMDVEHNTQRTGRFTPHHMTCSVLQSTKIYLAPPWLKPMPRSGYDIQYTHTETCAPPHLSDIGGSILHVLLVFSFENECMQLLLLPHKFNFTCNTVKTWFNKKQNTDCTVHSPGLQESPVAEGWDLAGAYPLAQKVVWAWRCSAEDNRFHFESCSPSVTPGK